MGNEVRNYRDLIVWQKAVDLAAAVHEVIRGYPKYELFGLTDQTRRAAVSVPANIAEGAGRFGVNEYRHHLSIARGSLAELRTLLELGMRFGYLQEPCTRQLQTECDEVDRMIYALHTKLG